MALREQFESSGGWLFRWRGYMPLAIIALIVFVMRDFHYLGNSPHLNSLWEIGCVAVSFLGLGIRAYTIGHTPKNTSGRNAREQRAESTCAANSAAHSNNGPSARLRSFRPPGCGNRRICRSR